jgi:hypothetical protein
MSDSTRSRANHGQRNREIDALDLSASIEILPAPADPTFSPLAHVGRPVDPDESETALVADPTPRSKVGTAASFHERSPRRRRKQPDSAIDDVRSERDQTRDRLVREALLARGLDPDMLVKKAIPQGGKHRPTIELSPDEYAAIHIATAVRPDLFGRTLVSFIRTCATNWETIADSINTTHSG